MNPRIAIGAVSLIAALSLTGCGPTGEAGDDETSSPTPRPTRSATATPTPTPSATPSTGPAPAPAPEPAETRIDARGAYDRCVALSTQYLYADRSVTPAPYGSANVIARTDGLWYVYTEVTVNDAPDAAQRDVAYECVLGGTYENPRDEIYGAVTRSPLSARDPNAPLPTG